MRFADKGMAVLQGKFRILIGIFVVGVLAMVVCCFLFVSWMEGVAFTVGLIILAYVVFQIYLFYKNDGTLSAIWVIVNFSIASVLVIGACTAAIILDDFSTYEGLTFSGSVLLFILWFISLFMYFKDFRQIQLRPLYFSSAIFPIYKYNPNIQNVEEHYYPTVMWILGLGVIFAWTIYSTFSLTPSWFGVTLSILIE